jgi:prolyl 4-hydroxylase
MSGSEIQFRKGMAMLADPTLAGEWRAAVEAIDDAADAGHAEALERRALFECMGVNRQVDWARALDSLAAAAESGSRTAGRQMALLAEDRFEAKLGRRDWKALRSQIRIDERLRPPAAYTVSSNPLIRSIEQMASAAECRWLIAAAEPRLERAIVYSNETGEHRLDPGRTNQFALFNFLDLDLVSEMIRERISATLGAPVPCLEVSQVLRYGVGEEFVPHCDFLDPDVYGAELGLRGQRAATVLIYLNEDFEGGETSFEELKIEHRGRTGDALVFSNVDPRGNPDARTKHAGRPPTRGEKWVFSQWVRDRIPG